jgi:two-component system sensor histidine kinase RegB
MTLLLDELEQDYHQQPELGADLALLKQQLESCKKILKSLVSTADAHSHGEKTAVAISHYLQQLLSHWQVLRPQSNFHLSIASQCQQHTLQVEPTLEQAICNLLNNAADASDQAIEITASCQPDCLLITIRDHGAGIAMEIAEQIGKPFVSTKGKGLGLGLFLSHATINRYGGSIELFNHDEGGTLAELRLPLNSQSKGAQTLDNQSDTGNL